MSSTAPVSVVPAVATTATGVTPSCRSVVDRLRALRVRPSVCARRSGSRGRCARRCRGPRRRGAPSSAPRPSSRAPSSGRPGPRGGRPGSARSRAAVSAVRFAIVPPAARRPQASSSNPTNCPTHLIVCSSSRSAAPALFATLTSCEAISASARTPISRPEDPMYANQRGRACASERSSTSAAASSALFGSVGAFGSGRLNSSRVRALGRGWPGRGWSKLRQASAISSAACSRTCSRSGSGRAGPSVCGRLVVDATALPAYRRAVGSRELQWFAS